ncbi:MAG: SprT-like domain-containing protein [Candidatus Binatia bacterium]
MPNPEATIPSRLQRRLDRWLHRWGTPSLAATLRIEYLPRLRRAFGRCYQDERLIRLTPSLRDTQSHLLAEILCHEAAHAAVYERHGASAKPHGSEWEEMMRMAGFEPRVRIPVVVQSLPRDGAKDRAVYLHHCPVCDLSRQAARPMRTWRCRTCVSSRRQGQLVIRRETGRGTRRQAGGARERKRVAAVNGSAEPRATTSARKAPRARRR